jgi:hypothetical protein
MRTLLPLVGLLFGIPLIFVSLPWFLWGIGHDLVGHHEAFERAVDRSPLSRYFDWIEAR